MEKFLNSPASFRSISFTSCISKLFERIILPRLLFFLKYDFILSFRQTRFHPGRSILERILFLSQFFLDGFTTSKPGSGTIFLRSILRLSTLSGSPPFFTNLFRLATLLALLVKINFSFLIGALVWFFEIIKVRNLIYNYNHALKIIKSYHFFKKSKHITF